MSTALYLGAQRVGTLSTGGGSPYDSVRYFDTVSDMVSATDLSVGQATMTLGYYAANDGGGATYTIVAASTGTADGGSYIDITGSSVQAKLVQVGDTVYTKQFGVYADGTHNDAVAIQNAIIYAETMNLGTILNPPGDIVVYGESSHYIATLYTVPVLTLCKPINFIGSGVGSTKFIMKDPNGDLPSTTGYTVDVNPFMVYLVHETGGFKIGEFELDGSWMSRDDWADETCMNNQNGFRIYRYNDINYGYPDGVIFENMYLHNLGGEAMYSGVVWQRNCTVRNVKFEYCMRSNGNLTGWVHYDACHFKNVGSIAIEMAIAPNDIMGYLKVTNCRFENMTWANGAIATINTYEYIYVDEQDGDHPSLTWGCERGTSVLIDGNIFYGVDDDHLYDRPVTGKQYSCFGLNEIESAVISNNIIYDANYGSSSYGIDPRQVTNLTVSNNHFISKRRNPARLFTFPSYEEVSGLKSLMMVGNVFSATHTLEYGEKSGVRVLAELTPNMTVWVQSGSALYAADPDLAIAAADVTHPRIDLVYMSTDISEDPVYLGRYLPKCISGTPSEEPTAPALPEDGQFAIATILVEVGCTAITYDLITDVRVINRSRTMHPIVVGAGTLPMKWIYKDNINYTVCDNVVLTNVDALLGPQFIVPFVDKVYLRIHYAFTCTEAGELTLKLLDNGSVWHTFDEAVDADNITTDGISGVADYTMDFTGRSYSGIGMPVSFRGHFHGTGGVVSFKIELLDFEYSAMT